MKKGKIVPILLSAALACSATGLLFACGNSNDEAETYSVTYAKSTLNETGAVPVDATEYKEGDQVTVKGKGELALENYTFSGWVYNGTTYTEGSKITMPAKDITLTAKWTEDQEEPEEPIVEEITFDGTLLDGSYAYHMYTFEGTAGENYTIALDEASEFTVFFTMEALQGGEPEDISLGKSAVIKMPESGECTVYLLGGYYSEGDTYTGTLTITKGGTFSYTVLFYESNRGGRPMEVVEDVAEGATVTLPETPVRADYDFAGWYVVTGDSMMGFTYTDTEFTAETVVTSDMYVAAKWEPKPKDNNNITIDDIEIGAFTTNAAYVYPEKIVAGQKVTVNGTYTGSTANVFGGVFAMISDDESVSVGATPKSFVRLRYDNFFGNQTGQDGDSGYTAVTNFTVAAARTISFDGADAGWFENFQKMAAALNGKSGTLKIELDYTSGAYILLTYTLTANFSIDGTAAAANHTFVQQYKITNSVSNEFRLALIGEQGKLQNASITRVSAANDKLGSTESGAAANGGTYTYTAASATVDAATGTIWNPGQGAYELPVLTKGNEVIVYGTQTGAVAANWDSLLWEFSEGYSGRSDNYGWTFGDKKLGSNLDGDGLNGTRGSNPAYKNFLIKKADGTVSENWADYAAIARNCKFSVHASWLEDGFITVTLTMTSETAGTYVNTVRLAVDDSAVTAFNLHIGGEKVTLGITGYATVAHAAK